MEIKMLTGFWYYFWLFASIGTFLGLYFLLRKKSIKTQKIVLFSLLVFGLILHFLKCYFPPYSTDIDRLYRDIWFVNICGANILLFVFIYIGKNSTAKDYMFFLGILGGAIAVVYPIEPIEKPNQLTDTLDIIRFYIHHTLLWVVPLLMVMLGHHKISYKNVWKVPGCLMLVLAFIMLNQIFQSELGFIPLRGNDIINVNYKNTSYIWSSKDDAIGGFLSLFCPNIFKTIPVGPHAGEAKHWPWFWLLVPAYVLLTPICFLISLIFDYKNFKTDVTNLFNKTKNFIGGLKK